MNLQNNSLGLRLAAINFLLNLSFESSGLLLPLYANDMGASKFTIGLIISAHGMSFFISSFVFGRQADIRGRTVFVRLGLGAVAVAYLLQSVVSSPAMLLAARAFVGLSLGICTSALTAYVYESEGHIGKFSSYGALGWVAGAVCAGVLGTYSLLFMASSAASGVAFLMALTLKETAGKHSNVAVLPWKILRENRKLYLAFLLRQIGAQAAWSVSPLFMASIGASKSWIAVMSGINTGGQFVALRFADRFNPVSMVTVGLLGSVAVFAGYGTATNFIQLLPVQVLLAISWSCLFIGAMTLLLRKNVEHGTAAGLLYSMTQLSAGVGPFLGGAMAQAWGFNLLMYASSALSFVSFLTSRGLEKRTRSQPASTAATTPGNRIKG
ncbi:MAG: MFS transporter [Chloroflexi bacterium]|nr:MFS transporter [Chloroflexota bacterium]